MRIVSTVVVAVLVVVTGLSASSAQAARDRAAGEPPVTLPSAPTGLTSPVTLPADVDPVSPYLPQVMCNPVDMTGPLMLRDLLLRTYGIGRQGSISRGCTEGLSEHSEGRAMDWMVDSRRPAERAAAADFLAWLTRDDGVNARRLGVMYVIYDEKIWSVYNVRAGWRPSRGHVDHVHVSFSWNGARGSTSFWTGQVGVVDFGPCARFAGSYAPPTTTPRAVPCGTPSPALVRTSRGKRAFGSTGGTVRLAQKLLRVPVTSRFDRATWDAVRGFQRAHDLPVTGALDHPTWASLDRSSVRRRSVTGFGRTKAAVQGAGQYSTVTLSEGSAGRAVAILQKALGLSLVDRNGYFGPRTRAAVVRVQQGAGLAADGAVSGEEWRAIRSSLN